ncbi:MAG: peptidoglycan DD-metalloendopeptidase family protein [Bacteroidales bacterium]
MKQSENNKLFSTPISGLLAGWLIPAILPVFITAFILTACNSNRTENDNGTADSIAVSEPPTEYGIRIDSMLVERGVIKKNEFLADLLLHYGVSYQVIDELVRKAKPLFDIRRIRAGNRYSVLLKDDSLRSLACFVYEETPTKYIVFDLRDSVHIHRGEKEVKVKIKKASGVIGTSLWNAMVDRGTEPDLANELSEIYAWTIDFFGLQKGDTYRMMYEALYVDDKYIGHGKVTASVFTHSGHDYYAFYFVQDSTGDYFDETGGSLRRTFLKAPLRYSRISSRFSNSRLHPVLKIRRPHHGVDYAAPAGTPVHAIGDGVVTEARYRGANGRIVKIKHNGTYTTAYLHLSGFAKGIKPGVFVRQGDVIGYVGSSGLSTGPHLDFRFYRNGQAIDPLKAESPPANPVDSSNMERFKNFILPLQKELENIEIQPLQKTEQPV